MTVLGRSPRAGTTTRQETPVSGGLYTGTARRAFSPDSPQVTNSRTPTTAAVSSLSGDLVPVVDDQVIFGEDYSDAVLFGERWERRSFERCDFSEADMRKLVTSGCTFTNCTFARTDFGDSQHNATAFRSCTFDRTVLAGAKFSSCSLLGSTFTACVLRPITVRETDLTLAVLAGENLRKQDLSGLRLREANLSEADLRDADLRGADLAGARLLGTKLSGADLRGAKLDGNGYVQAQLAGARVDLQMAVAYAAAHGLLVEE
jgi:uncharacterized protein YjbI with pentapeptide repeats